MFIYKITNLVNNKVYIGQTITTLKERFRHHCSPSSNTYLSRAIRKYGKENFKIELVCRAENLAQLNQREENIIRIFNTLKPNGYNIAKGGMNKGRITSPMKGRKHSEETKKLMSDRAKGKPKSREAAMRMSASKRGIKRTPEAIEKSRIGNLGKSRNGKKVVVNGQIFSSISEASKILNISRRNLYRKLNGIGKSRTKLIINYLKE